MPDLVSQNILLPLFHLPPLAYLRAIAAAETVYIEAEEHFIKSSFRNRWEIAAANKVQLLSIPLVKGKNKQQPIRAVQIAYHDPWQREHWRAIESAYRSSPFWEHYADSFQKLYMANYVTLWERNLALLEWLMQQFKCQKPFLLTAEYKAVYTDIVDIREGFSPVQLRAETRYPQPFEAVHGFRGGLSAIDCLFCVGGQGLK